MLLFCDSMTFPFPHAHNTKIYSQETWLLSTMEGPTRGW